MHVAGQEMGDRQFPLPVKFSILFYPLLSFGKQNLGVAQVQPASLSSCTGSLWVS